MTAIFGKPPYYPAHALSSAIAASGPQGLTQEEASGKGNNQSPLRIRHLLLSFPTLYEFISTAYEFYD